MESSVVQFRVETKLKNEAQAIFDKLGLDLPTAFRIFLKRSVEDKGIPFSMTLKSNTSDWNGEYVSLEEGKKAFYEARKQAAAAGIQDMSLDEINAEIQAYRAGH